MNHQLKILNDKKYKSDVGFQAVNKQFLTLNEEESQRNNRILNEVINNTFIPLMKEDQLFADLFERIEYSGSYYKGTRFGQPDEFDLDFVLNLPINYSNVKIETNHSNFGYAKINLESVKFYKHSDVLTFWVTEDGYLNQNKIRSWFESVFTCARHKLSPATPTSRRVVFDEIRERKSGPAFTLTITCREENKEWKINVDLVPSLEFAHPLGKDFRNLENKKKKWLAIPKPLFDVPDGNVFWRISFYVQEKDFLEGHLKDVIKMMKKYRDTKNLDKICSFFIENLYYLELFERSDSRTNLLGASKTALFMLGLKKLEEALVRKEIKFFWNSRLNLLNKIHEDTLENYSNVVKNSVSKIDREMETNPYILADVVLTSVETLSVQEKLTSLRL